MNSRLLSCLCLSVALLIAATQCHRLGPPGGSLEHGARADPRVRQVSAAELAGWRLLGIGEAQITGEGVRLSEGARSEGVVLLSPEPLAPDVILSYKIRPNRFEGVMLTLLAVSGLDGKEVDIPADCDGAMAFWNGPNARTHNFLIAFHTGFHQPFAFMNRNPGGVPIARKEDTATAQRWYEIETGRVGQRVWLKVDGRLLLQSIAAANAELPAGCLGFRLRGPGDGSFSAEIRQVQITEILPN